jgi:peptide/nickel transport system permease protein
VLAYLIRRILWAGVLVVAMTFVTFVILFKIPADPARFLVPNQNPAEYQLEAAREKLGVDDPFFVQYGRFLWRTAHLDLGYSYTSVGYRDPVAVTEELRQAIPVTLSLLLGGAVLWLSVAIPLGTISAVRAGSLLDRGLLVFVLLGISSHPVVVGLFFRQFLGYELGLAPVEGYCAPFGANGCGPHGWAHHMLLPWLTISVLFAALYSRMVRIHVINELHEGYVRTARAKGARESRVIRRHVLRNSLLPILAMLGMDVGLVFGTAVFVEEVFGLAGLGSLALGASAGLVGFDLPVIAGVILVVSLAVVIFNLIVDLMMGVVDPRVRVIG